MGKFSAQMFPMGKNEIFHKLSNPENFPLFPFGMYGINNEGGGGTCKNFRETTHRAVNSEKQRKTLRSIRFLGSE